jgi:hypothetical protein
LAREQKGDRLERIIGQRLAAGRGAGDAQCPDASIIAAYRERSLPREQRAECERHFAQCARCGGALAALARVEDAPAADLAHVAVERRGVATATAAGGDRRAWWRLRGPLPLAAFGAAAAIVIIVAIRTFSAPHSQLAVEARSELQAKSLAANAATTAAKSSDGAALGSNSLGGSNALLAMNQPTRAESASPPPLQKSFALSVPQQPPLAAASMRRQPPPPEVSSMARELAPGASHDELKERKASALERDKKTGEVAAAPAAPIAAPMLAAEASSSATAANSSATFAAPVAVPTAPATASGAFAGSIAAAPAPAAPVALPAAPSFAAGSSRSAGAAGGPAAVSGAAGGTAAASGATVSGGAAASGAASAPLSDMAAGVVGPKPGANAIVVEAPDHTVAWMVGAHGAISRYSAATGWVAKTSGVTADLSGGSAPSATACWIVGRAGTILRTVDGDNWTRVAAPVSADLSGVVASSASDATIFTARGRRFATSDGGATWRPL